jgi:hypothetical protein
MKRISKLRLYHAASSGFILAVIPTFLIIMFLGGGIASHPSATLLQLVIYIACFAGITFWIYNSDSEFQIYYCTDCAHEWPRKRHHDDSCPKCKSQKYIYNYKP